jgi:hypothetical protein
MVGRRMAAEHQSVGIATSVKPGGGIPSIHFSESQLRRLTIANLAQRKSRPTERFYKKKGLAFTQGLICTGKFFKESIDEW